MFRIIILFFLIICPVFFYGQKNNAELTYQETNIIVKSNKLYKKSLYEIKINNRAGEKYTKVRIPYSKFNTIKKIEANIKDRNGKVIKKLKKSDVINKSDISDISFYEDDFIKEFTLKHNIYPYYLTYSFEEEFTQFFYIAYWRPIIGLKTSTKEAKLTIEVPQDYNVFINEQDTEKYEVQSIEKIKKYSWKASYNNFFEPESFSPRLNESIPRVTVLPENFTFDISGSYKTWITFGNWKYDLIKDLNDLPEDEQKKILSLIDGIKDDKEKIKILYHYLQDATRYINIKLETGGFKPYPASYVAANKYGDCKALTNYFNSVLELAGITSYYSNIFAGNRINYVDKSFVSQQFNHIILCVPFETDTVWLDCTSDAAFGYLGTFTQNRNALIIEKDKSHFVKTPALSVGDVLERRVISINHDIENKGKADFFCSYKGTKYEMMFQILKYYTESERKRTIRDYFIENGFEFTSFELIPEDRDSAIIHLSYAAKSNNIYKRYGNELIIKVLQFDIPVFEPPLRRKQPVQIDYPVNKIDTIKYSIPKSYHVSGELINQSITSHYGHYSIKFEKLNDKVIITKRFVLNRGYYELSQYKEFYEFIDNVNTLEKKSNIIFTK